MYVSSLYLHLAGVGFPTVSAENRGGDLLLGCHVWITNPVTPDGEYDLVLVAGGRELRRARLDSIRSETDAGIRLGRIRWDQEMCAKWVATHDVASPGESPRVLLDDGTEIGVDELVGGSSTRSTPPAHQLHSN